MEDKSEDSKAEELVGGGMAATEAKNTEEGAKSGGDTEVEKAAERPVEGKEGEAREEDASTQEARESKPEVQKEAGKEEEKGRKEGGGDREEKKEVGKAMRKKKEGEGVYGSGRGEEGGEEEEEEEEEDVFGALSTFTSEVLGALGCPAEPLSSQDRSPRPLPQVPTDISSTMKLLQDLMTYDDEEPDMSYGPGPSDPEGRLAAVSHLLAALVTTLDTQHLRRLATRLMSDSCLWVSRLFRYFESTAYIHEDVREGVVRVSRMLLHTRYPRYGQEGYHALYTRPPVIYTAATVRPGLPQHLATMLGLGSGCLRVVPCADEGPGGVGGASGASMDTAALSRMMAEDAAAHKRPFLVLANTGGGLVGGVDNVSRVLEVCGVHDAWLHAEGHALAALTLPNTPNLPARVCDSMTLPLSLWLGIPSLPYVTLYKAQEASAVHSAGLTALSLHVRLSCLPLWTALMSLGQNGVVSRLQHSFELSQYLQLHLANLARIRMLSPAPPEADKVVTIQDLVNKPVSTAQLLETVSGSVVFQYVEEGNEGNKNSEYYDNLNSWLGQVVRRDVGSVGLELVQLETAGLVLRWSPLEAPDTHHLTRTHLDHLMHSLHHQLDILNATVEQRKTFTELVASASNLRLVDIPGWAGLGGVRYMAELWRHQESPTETSKEDINALNVHLVSQLKATDSAFSLGEGSDGLNCVRFGMVTADTDLSELLSLVLSTGREVERSSRFLDQMTDIVRKGIEAATEDLKRENEERLWQEGILRHVPIVGSVYNWFSPPPTQGIKGRTLDLTAGVLESTENIYRYHMQIRHGTSRTETKLPPAPSIQMPVTPSPSHSRTSSNTSNLHSRHVSENQPFAAQEVKSPPVSANGVPAAVQS